MSKEFDKNIVFEISGKEIASVINNYQYDILKIDFTDQLAKNFVENNQKVKETNKIICPDLSPNSFVGNKIIISQYTLYENSNPRFRRRLDGKDYEIEIPSFLNDSYFAISSYENNEIIVKKYRITYSDYLEIIPIEEFIISEEAIKAGHVQDKLKNIADIVNFTDNLVRLFFGIFSTHKGMPEIYPQLRKAINTFKLRIDHEWYKDDKVLIQYEFFKNMYTELFFCLIEGIIKDDMDYEYLYEENPVFTHEPFSERIIYPKKIKDYIDHYNLTSQKDFKQIDNLIKQVGMDRAIEFIDFFDQLNHTPIYFNSYHIDILTEIYRHTDIKPSVLIKRMTKAYFEESIDPAEYLICARDYCKMNELLGNENTGLPKDLKDKHNKLQELVAEINFEKQNKAFSKVAETNKELLQVLPENDKYIIVCPENGKDLINEGMALNHCVGSYVGAYVSGDSKIFFVREKNSIEASYVTLELNSNNNLVQIRGFNNSRPNAEVIAYVKEWVNRLGGNIYE